MTDKTFTYEDMEEVYEVGYARADWETQRTYWSKQYEDVPIEEPEFRVFMHDKHNVSYLKTFIFQYRIEHPVEGLICMTSNIHANNSESALDYFKNLDHTGPIVYMSMGEIKTR